MRRGRPRVRPVNSEVRELLSRRARLAAAVVSAALLLVAAAGAAPVALGPRGIGAVQLGLPELKAVKELTHLFGAPSARGVNTGCGRRYTEVEWGDLVAEFRLGTFSGFRYINGGYPLTTPGSPRNRLAPGRSSGSWRRQWALPLGAPLLSSELPTARSALWGPTGGEHTTASSSSTTPNPFRRRGCGTSSRSSSEPAATSNVALRYGRELLPKPVSWLPLSTGAVFPQGFG